MLPIGSLCGCYTAYFAQETFGTTETDELVKLEVVVVVSEQLVPAGTIDQYDSRYREKDV